jgi:hypothetical protein
MDQLQDLNFTVPPVIGIEDENIRQPGEPSSNLANGRITRNLEQQKEGKNEKDLYTRNYFDGADSMYSAPDSGGT